MISFTFLNIETWKKSYASFPIGLVPNLSHGKGSRTNFNPSDTANQLQLECYCLSVILEDIIDIHTRGGVKSRIFEKEKKLILWFHLIIGDIQGYNNLAVAYQNSGFRPY